MFAFRLVKSSKNKGIENVGIPVVILSPRQYRDKKLRDGFIKGGFVVYEDRKVED